ncbi:hypothetical protein D5R81_12310 [Parashewanella spongiae]|uniref:ATP-dependent exonuclease SbcCD, C subunit-like protein n=1 Tax=Parashewanella spongiae TaxID=342950 RepID=A0A3A6TU90_9GAMM|nr:ATP-binding protein [Parashewanella spongiae]MCL1078753.1 hypothetical protein [Parashewanella spongiae]RJY12503.1 hypothetical protein D5R81_12310 [Parashewanella spongiae]
MISNNTPASTSLGGFRLHDLQVLNWGTFDGQIWNLHAQSGNSLLTGNIGSGKSTLIDALTTLLVPTRKLAFNKAAGAEDKERTFESYFHGYYTSQQDANGKAQAIGLRNKVHYTVVLGQFYSQNRNEWITMAQVFWIKPDEHKVKRLFVVAQKPLTIAREFTDFGSKILDLRKRLRKQNDIDMFDTFGPYQQSFSKLLGLGADGKALELFNQTISMKSVGSVTEFVRSNMLSTPDIEAQVSELERNYDDLKRMHDAVVSARLKVDLLKPVEQFGQQALEAGQQKQHFELSRELVDAFMANIALPLYQKNIQRTQLKHQQTFQEIAKVESQERTELQSLRGIEQDIASSGGHRLSQLTSQIEDHRKQHQQRQLHHQEYIKLVQALEFNDFLSPEQVIQNIAKAKVKASECETELEQHEHHSDDLKLQLNQHVQQQTLLNDELNALKKRTSNIPARQLHIREMICDALDLSEDQLPFVGELIQVKSEQQQWQGVIERVLHSFALSLVVPEGYYDAINRYINQTHLGGKLVYFRADEDIKPIENSQSQDQLPAKIIIKPDTPYYTWLLSEILKRFNYQCCDDLTHFRRFDKAITALGLIKSSKARHEKDDRHNIADKSRYVLGWSNKEKVELLEAELQHTLRKEKQIKISLEQYKAFSRDLTQLHRKALNLAEFSPDFERLDHLELSQRMEQLETERQQLMSADSQLAELEKQKQHIETLLADHQQQRTEKLKDLGGLEITLEHLQQALASTQEVAKELDTAAAEQVTSLQQVFEQYGTSKGLRIDMLSKQTSLLRQKLNQKIHQLEDKRSKREQKMALAMREFANQFPNDCSELDTSLQALAEYCTILAKLVEEDLPRHEQRFKDMLNRDTIRSMALFRSQLDKQEEEILSRIQLINRALLQLDYQNGTYIEIDAINAGDTDIREFKQRLKQCVEYSSDDNLYSEQKFEQVKSLIEQLRNEPKWTQKVVDVRFWFLFNVVERYREDHSEKECYSDSGGKSGGQKEKLAYSILAAAILLQYQLISDQTTSNKKRQFNLVVIDEAFARGSKDSTRFGLELFKKLGLQLLLVTPMQKLDIIEHYIQNVHFVDQKNNRSILLNMTIEQYQEKLKQSQELQKYRAMVTSKNTEQESVKL